MKFSKKTIISAAAVLISLILIAMNTIPSFATFVFLVASVFLTIEIVKMAIANEKGKPKRIGIGFISSFGMALLLFFALGIVIPKSEIPQLEINTELEAVSEIESTIESTIESKVESGVISEKEATVDTVTSLIESEKESKAISSKFESKVESKVVSSKAVSSKAVSSKEESKIESKNENKVESKTVSKTESKAESKVGSQVESKAESKVESVVKQPELQTFVFYANMDSGIYHTHNCQAAQRISAENLFTYTVTAYNYFEAEQLAINYFESNGYRVCRTCER